MEFVPLDLTQLKAEYDAGASLRALAIKYNTSKVTIKKKLLKAGAVILSSAERIAADPEAHSTASRPRAEHDEAVVIELARSGACATEIVKTTGYSEPTVLRILRRAGMELDVKASVRRRTQEVADAIKQPWDTAENLGRLYENLSVNEIARLYELDEEAMRTKLIDYGIKRRSLSESTKLADTRPGVRAKKLAALQLANTPEAIAKRAASLKLCWQDEAYRAKIFASMANRDTVSRPQRVIYEILSDLGVEYVIEYRLGPWPFDCFVPAHNLLIEHQGCWYHSPDHPNGAARVAADKRKAEYVANFHPHLRLHCIWEDEFADLDRVRSIICGWLGQVAVVELQLSHLRFGPVAHEAAKRFMELNHYSGTAGNNAHRYGAHLDDKLVAVCNFGQITRIETATRLGLAPGEALELTRLAVRPGYHTANLCSWLVGRALRSLLMDAPKARAVVSFADTTRGHTGTVYKACNFEYDGDTKPSYWYVHESGWAMHKKTLWDKAKALGLSEVEFALAKGFVRVDGLAKRRFVYWLRR